MQVVIDDILTSYQKTGDQKDSVLFVHGWADSSESIKPLLPDLTKKFTVYALDLPGFGKTEMPKNAWTISDYSKFLAKFVKKIEISPTAIIGHSNGGAISINVLANNHFQTKKLVLLASSGIRHKNSVRKNLLKIAARPAKIVLKILPRTIQDKLKQKAYSKIGSDFLLLPEMKQTFKNVVGFDVGGDASNIAVPSLLIYGEDDKATPPEYGTILAEKIPNSKLVIITGAGHFVHHDQPKEVGKLIEEFLK